MKKEVILSFLVISLVILTSCSLFKKETPLPEPVTTEEPTQKTEVAVPPEPEVPEEPKEPEINLSCTHNANCTWGKMCIEGTCQVLADLYKVNETCQKCKVTKVEILTSDGETYTLPPGRGSYTAAGALDWTIVSGGEYCRGETPIIPLKILKRNYGQIFSDEVILLKEGETSKVITHPFISRVAFTLTIQSVEETCS